MSKNEFEWDWDAQEVRNSDRSLWLRRSSRREGMHGRGVQPELYAIFEKDYSVGFMSTHNISGSTQNPATFVGNWERGEDGIAITQINRLTTVMRFNPIADRLEELGPYQPSHDRFKSHDQQERLIAALPRMLSVLPESFNQKELNQSKADGRIGYHVNFSKELEAAMKSGALIQ